MTYSRPRVTYRSHSRFVGEVINILRFELGRGFHYGLVIRSVCQAVADRPEGTPQEICEDVVVMLSAAR